MSMTNGKGEHWIPVAWLCVLVACSCSTEPSSGDVGAPGGAGGGASSGAGGSGAGGSGAGGLCPPGFECTAPAGSFVCTAPATGLPPVCDGQQPCPFGQCQAHGDSSFCTQSCGLDPVPSCPAGAMCTQPASAYLCAEESTGLPPACATQPDCPYGLCMSYSGQSYCTLPCVSPVTTQCPAETSCVGIGPNFICVSHASGMPPTCGAQPDCAFGQCLEYEGQKYCTQPCAPSVVESCPAGAECNVMGDYWLCTPPATAAAAPTVAVCSDQQPCAYGDCVASQGQSYCLQYCSQPVVAVYGSAIELAVDPQTGGALWQALAGVEVCVFDAPSVPCVTTGPDGTFALKPLPEQGWFVLSMAKPGYQPVLRLAYPAQTLAPSYLYTQAQAQAFTSAIGATFPDDTTGHILFGAGAGAEQGEVQMTAGYSVSLDPASGIGPFYAGEDQQIDPALTAASGAGWGALFNLAPGDYELTFTHPSLQCGEPVGARVAAGYLTTHIAAICQ